MAGEHVRYVLLPWWGARVRLLRRVSRRVILIVAPALGIPALPLCPCPPHRVIVRQPPPFPPPSPNPRFRLGPSPAAVGLRDVGLTHLALVVLVLVLGAAGLCYCARTRREELPIS
eukprot:2619412-Rhodomonas_salina.1